MSKLKKTALWITLLALVLKLIGFVRESVIASEFGATDYTDGFILAFTFVTLMKTLIKNGFNSVFLPEYKKNQRENPEEADRNANSMLNYTIVFLMAVTVICYFLTPFIVQIYGDMTETTEMVAIKMTKIFFLFTLVIGLTSVLESYLQAVRSFVPNQVLNLLGTVMATLFIIFFADRWGIYSIAYGFIFGLGIGLIIQIYYLYKYGYRWELTFKINRVFAKTFFILLVPALLHSSVGHINVFVNKMFASGTVSGAVTYLNNASLLMSIPSAIFQTTIVAIIFTLMSEQREMKEKFKKTLYMGYQIGFLTLFPLAIGLFLVGDQAISFIFERGEYTPEDTRNTVTVLYMYIPLIVTQGLILIPIKGMYALGKTKKLLKISSTTIILNALLNYLFLIPFGYPGLALSSSVVSLYYISFVTYGIYTELPKGEGTGLLKLFIKVALPTALMAVPILAIEYLTPIEELYSLFQLMILVPIGGLTYIVGLYLFYREGFNKMLEVVRRKAKKA
ncbi:murein biosynthesis integral membrane protein MurJ [Halobacillus yeomjeoni]|uniref:Murein biosynthesis integral membrane protein MurJ n=1 Tax=Halobacillus yeomjeoni TaxID=311194 RepID=A0A931HWH7_9BACI|nr:murein biosynthesis integral membrane protein MurJ [Halobacillus yeomjeoni]MBH0230709.1 murein biosynthesis integral membrane protein MurJ [Halobacillus yeomjeoni]